MLSICMPERRFEAWARVRFVTPGATASNRPNMGDLRQRLGEILALRPGPQGTAITGLSIPAQTYLLEFGDRVAHPLRVRIGVELKRRLERVAPVLLARATRSYAAHRAPHRDRSPNSATQRDIAPRSATYREKSRKIASVYVAISSLA